MGCVTCFWCVMTTVTTYEIKLLTEHPNIASIAEPSKIDTLGSHPLYREFPFRGFVIALVLGHPPAYKLFPNINHGYHYYYGNELR